MTGWLGYQVQSERMAAAGPARFSLPRKVKRIFVAPPDSITALEVLRKRAGRTELAATEADACWQIIRGMSAAEVQGYLEELPLDLGRTVNGTLAGLLFYRWAQLDPLTAAEQSEKPPYSDQRVIRQVMTAWLASNPEAAMQWASALKRDSPVRTWAGSITAEFLARQDPDHCLERTAAISPQALESALCRLARDGGATGEAVKDFLKRPETQLDDRVLENFARAWSQRETGVAALTAAEQFGLAPGKRETLQKALATHLLRTDPQSALDWMVTNDRQRGSKIVSEVFPNYAFNDSTGAAADWALRQGQPQLLADSVRAQAAEIVQGQLHHPDWKTQTGLPKQFRAWQQMQPEEAGQWLASMPADFQERLTRTATPPADASR